jgi:hypothetical protein
VFRTAALIIVVGVAVAGCSSSPKTIPATIDIPTTIGTGVTQVRVSGVRCVPHGRSVTVTGTLTGWRTAAEPGVEATIYDSDGKQIGQFVTGEPLSPGQSHGFTLTGTTTGMAARCVVYATVVGGSAP